MLHMSDPLSLMIHRLDTPIGEMLIVMDHDGYLRAVDWADHDTGMHRLLMIHYGQSDFSLKPAHSPSELTDAIKQYFRGKLTGSGRCEKIDL